MKSEFNELRHTPITVFSEYQNDHSKLSNEEKSSPQLSF